MPSNSNLLKLIPESAISEMSQIADRYKAINLASGHPDFDPPQELIAAAERALRTGHNQYVNTWGVPELRHALAEKLNHFMGFPVDPQTDLTITCGGTEAMMATIISLVNPGEKVIVFSPFYETYTVDPLFAGAEVLFVSLRPPDFNFDPDELRQAFRKGAKALVLCNPSNPSGKVFTRQELEFIARLAQEYDAFIIADEVYEHIIYPPHRHTYIAGLPGMFEHTISCGSFSKTYSITGWRLGYTLAPAGLSAGIRKIHDYLSICAPAPLQNAIIPALKFPDSYYRQLQDAYTQRRDIFLGYLEQAGLSYTPPQGAYFVLVDISPFDYPSDIEFCHWLAQEIGVAAVPGSSFFHEPVNHLIRLNFAKSETLLNEAGERLLRLKEFIR
jgi:aspartate/methionine/tyrosine aminotransferase